MDRPYRVLGACVFPALLLACGPSDRPAPGEQATASTTAGATAAPEAADVAGVELKAIAAKVVGQSAGVRENEVVELYGAAEDLPLLEEMAVEVRKRGAHPLLLVGSDKVRRRMFDEVSEKYDTQVPKAVLGLIGIVDVFIATEFGEARTFKGVSPERQAAQGKSFQQVLVGMRKRGIRSVTIGNGLYPTEERAEQLGMSRDDLAELMYGGINTDYERLEAAGERLRAALAKGKELRVTSPSGTDLRVPIAGRPVQVSDGVISAADRKQGGATLSAWLPAGEVYLLARPGGAEGVIAVDRQLFQGDRVEGLKLEIRGGKVARMTARSGLEPLEARYAAAGPGRDAFGVVDIGINPSIQAPTGSAVNLWSRAGAVTLAIGNDGWAGGDNHTDFGLAVDVPSATVTVDGTEVVKEGSLVEGTTVAAY